MQKINNLFKVEMIDGKRCLLPEFSEGSEWVQRGEFQTFVKRDGTSTFIKDGVFYKRFHNRKHVPIQDDWIACGNGRFWIPVDKNNPSDKWFNKIDITGLPDGSYEMIGRPIQNNAEQCDLKLIKHDSEPILTFPKEPSFFAIKQWVETFKVFEGVVLHSITEPKKYFKVKLNDFGVKRIGYENMDGVITHALIYTDMNLAKYRYAPKEVFDKKYKELQHDLVLFHSIANNSNVKIKK